MGREIQMMNVDDLLDYTNKYIQGGFWGNDARVLKEELEKLKPGDVYVEIGVDEGKSARVAHEYAPEGVYLVFIDINNVDPHSKSIGRGKWMQQEGMVGIEKKGFFIHGDADMFSWMITRFVKPFVSLLFIDGHHDYASVKANTIN